MRQAIKHLHTFSITVLCTFFAFGATFYVSCKKDKCKNVQCLNSGNCADGNCSCPSGTSGSRCETDEAAKFIGKWGHDTTINGGQVSYYYTINAGTRPGEVSTGFTSFIDSCRFDTTLTGIATGNTFTIGPLTLTDSCGHSTYCKRTGLISNGKFIYCGYDSSGNSSCLTFERKVE